MATVERPSTASRRVALGTERRKLVGRMGPWQLERVLHEGPLTRLYLASPADSEALSARYVLKLLRKEWWRDSAAIEMQRREAWIGRRISHPHILPILSAQIDQPPFFLITPKLTGQTVAEMLASTRRPSLPLTLWIARQIAEALAAFHAETGMIHADVKPSNIFVSPDGHATLLDCGCAQSTQELRTWASRPVVGTLHYIAPEMVTSAFAVDPRADIYSLGATLYEMVSGLRPWDAEDPAELASLHRQSQPVPVSDHCPEIPASVGSLIHRMLSKEPLRRPATAAEVAAQLVRLEIESFGVR